MSVTVEKQMIHETKGDTVAPGAEGLLNLQPDDFVFYVGCYPSNFTVSLAQPGHTAVPWTLTPSAGHLASVCPAAPWAPSCLGGVGGDTLTLCCAHSPRSPSASPATAAA